MKKSVVSEIMNEPVADNNDTHLWMAVMDRAVRDLIALEKYRQDPAVMEDPVFRYDYRTLKKWFHSPSMEPGSFNWICSLVNIDPKWALNRLEERLKVCLIPESSRKARLDHRMASVRLDASMLDQEGDKSDISEACAA